MESICDYSVEAGKDKTYGRLYYANVFELGDLEYEIEEIACCDKLPDLLTYERIQPYLYKKVIDYINFPGE